MRFFLRVIINSIIFFVCLMNICFAEYTSTYIAGGINYSNLKNSERLTLNQDVVNLYKSHQETTSNALAAIGILRTFGNDADHFQFSLGVSLYYINLPHVKGTLHPFINAGLFDTLQYQFSTNNLSLFIESRIKLNSYRWKPFILLGAGSAWNKLHRYQESPTNSYLSATPAIQQYTENTNRDIAYEMGFGIEYPILINHENPNMYSASLDYRYFNLGSGNFKRLISQTSNDRLSIKNIYTQVILLAFYISFQ